MWSTKTITEKFMPKKKKAKVEAPKVEPEKPMFKTVVGVEYNGVIYKDAQAAHKAIQIEKVGKLVDAYCDSYSYISPAGFVKYYWEDIVKIAKMEIPTVGGPVTISGPGATMEIPKRFFDAPWID